MELWLLGAASACAIALVSQSAQAVPASGQGTWKPRWKAIPRLTRCTTTTLDNHLAGVCRR